MSSIVESSKIKVVTRSTYDNPQYVKEPDVVYFVLEPTANEMQYVSLYIGTACQTDIISLDELLQEANNENSQTANDVPTNLITIKDKLYYWKDTTLDVYRGFIKDNGGIFPLYGTPIWESIDT